MKKLVFSFLLVFFARVLLAQDVKIERLKGDKLIDSLNSFIFSRQLQELRNVIYADTILENLTLRNQTAKNGQQDNSIVCPFRPLIIVDKKQVIYWDNLYDKDLLKLLASTLQNEIVETINYYDPLTSSTIYGTSGCSGSILIATKGKQGIAQFNGSVIN